jgi:hypothetical protein
VPGIFSSDQGHLAQYLQGPNAHVIQIADGRRHHIKRTGRGIQSTCSSQNATSIAVAMHLKKKAIVQAKLPIQGHAGHNKEQEHD